MRVGSETGLQMFRHANKVWLDAPPTVGADTQPPLGGDRRSWRCSPPNLPNVLELVTDPKTPNTKGKDAMSLTGAA